MIHYPANHNLPVNVTTTTTTPRNKKSAAQPSRSRHTDYNQK